MIELSPVDLKLAGHVTIALPYSSTELEGYEVVVKQLTDQINNTWEEIETIDIKDESGNLYKTKAIISKKNEYFFLQVFVFNRSNSTMLSYWKRPKWFLIQIYLEYIF